MSDTDTATQKPEMLPHHRFGLLLLLSVGALVGAMGLAALVLTGRMVHVPDWVTDRIEARLSMELAPATVALGAADIFFSRDGAPRVRLTEIGVYDAAGRNVVRLPELDATVSVEALSRGKLAVSHVALTGAEVALRRAPDGRFDLALGNTATPASTATSLAEVLDNIDRAFSTSALASVRTVSVESLQLSYEDARAGRSWRMDDGLMALEQDAEAVTLTTFFSLRGRGARPAEFAFTFVSLKGGPAAKLSASFSDVASAEIATQSPALAALALIDAPISGSVRTEVDARGQLGPFSAALEIGAGELKPAVGAPPIRFDAGKSYFRYDADRRRLNFDQIELDTAVLRLEADGHAYLRDLDGGWPRALVAQLGFRKVVLDPEGMFEDPAVFSAGALDLRVDLDPFAVDIGQAVLRDDARTYRITGDIRARPDGWQVAVDATLDRIGADRLLLLWPLDLAASTRKWFADHVIAGELQNVHAAVRLSPDTPPQVFVGHGFQDAEVTILKEMPPVTGAAGYSVLARGAYSLALEEGVIAVPGAGPVEVGGTVLHVPSVREPQTPAEITLHSRGSIGAGLALIDYPPLRIPSKSNLDHGIAEGEADIVTRLRLPLKRDLAPEDVDYQISGTLRDVRSDAIVPGRAVSADAVALAVTPTRISLSGPATIDGVPIEVTWTSGLGDARDGTSRAEGTIALSEDLNRVFGLGLPEGSLSGAADATFALDMVKGQPPRLSLASDLTGLGVSLPQIGWSKPKATPGTLDLAVTLDTPPRVDRLALSAPGLDVAGTVELRPAGGLDAMRLNRVRVGTWLNARAVLRGQGKGNPPALSLTGGSVDLERLPRLRGSGKGGPIDLSLDEVQVGKGIVLTDARGRLVPAGGAVSGKVAAKVRGGTPIAATLSPGESGTVIDITAANAGGVLRDAGLYKHAQGGTLNVKLTPMAGKGRYEGRLEVDDIRVGGIPVLVEVLNAISVVGMVEQLDGKGLSFSNVQSGFRLFPGLVEVQEASAVGPSLGVSLAGIYKTGSKEIDMQGVVSPIYILNAVGAVVSRRGEGLFGFNFSVGGTADKPKVGVNPLSILTPGKFRELFRAPPPRVAE
ncbi:Large exoproteins involved in heme utilization or adhesion [Rhodovulum sp. P5]|uniref:AsmA-like C-terminal region-containing protein n=1 Tax=Rhodovulum sp. P5 TaxID=1564506 RepID=UPI0009C24962|nr:AsmA-like C-terminal region-containing protein [Rhodovulum sp. P5]ARE42034.1 Large exoproteins involved in heme utilization or adhesion [Rhodovulum sp. P5]